ncbi:MAG: VOC family protein [Bacteroidales bacterium]|nr:VOC family protein [Bacteroidales bacterium]
MAHRIYGIQQIGLGTSNFAKTHQWYIDNFGFDAKIFEDNTVAELMLPYTGGQPHSRRAGLAMNLQGGSGLEIWQYKDRTPEPPHTFVQLGDFGIFAAKVKCPSAAKAHRHLLALGTKPLSAPTPNPMGTPHFLVADPAGNIIDVVEDPSMFQNLGLSTSGICGAIVGVSNIDDSLRLYSGILGYDKVLFDVQGPSEDFFGLPGGGEKIRRVLLTHSEPRRGGFSQLFGSSCIELVQCLERSPQKIFKNRLWGDIGFIHLCFDIKNMAELERLCNSKGFPFTVDSNVKGRFDMGDAAGHFTYIEDPDGTLIEFVETYKVPLLKPLGINLNMERKPADAGIPNWVMRLLCFKRAKKAV